MATIKIPQPKWYGTNCEDAYNAGWRWYQEGFKFGDNPCKNDMAAKAWEDGFNDAEADDMLARGEW